MGYLFEWDPVKAESNLQKHGVDFNEASTVFGDPFGLLMSDPDHSVSEMRYILLGVSYRQRLLVIVFTEHPPGTRIISARQATRKERREYEEDH